jgi:hypothetical protein
MTIRRWIIATALIAVICWGTLSAPIDRGVVVIAILGGLFALGAMRHPLLFLGLAASLRLIMPTVHDSGAFDHFHDCNLLGCFLGVIAGLSIRMVRKRWAAVPPPRAGRPEVIDSSEPLVTVYSLSRSAVARG